MAGETRFVKVGGIEFEVLKVGAFEFRIELDEGRGWRNIRRLERTVVDLVVRLASSRDTSGSRTFGWNYAEISGHVYEQTGVVLSRFQIRRLLKVYDPEVERARRIAYDSEVKGGRRGPERAAITNVESGRRRRDLGLVRT